MQQLAFYTLRPVRDEDEALLLEIYSSTRTNEMELVPWTLAQKHTFLQMQFFAQQRHYQAYFPQATHEIIESEGQPVGRLYVDRRETGIRILDITLLPQARGRGIGTQILLSLMKEAEPKNQSCSIYVESFNQSLGLFQRLGFVKVEENGASWLMEWRAGT